MIDYFGRSMLVFIWQNKIKKHTIQFTKLFRIWTIFIEVFNQNHPCLKPVKNIDRPVNYGIKIHNPAFVWLSFTNIFVRK